MADRSLTNAHINRDVAGEVNNVLLAIADNIKESRRSSGLHVA